MRKRKFVSIKSTLITICICFSVIPLILVSLFSTTVSKQALKDTAQQLTSEVIKQVASNMDVFISQVEEKMTEFIVQNTLTEKTFEQYYSLDNYEKLSANNDILAKINTFISLNGAVENAWYVTKDKTVLGMMDEQNYTTDRIAKIQEVEVGNQPTWIAGFGDYTDKIFVARELNNGRISGDIVLLEINLQEMVKAIETAHLLEGSSIAIVGQERNIIYSKSDTPMSISDQIWEAISTSETNEPFIESKELVTYSSMNNEWMMVVLVPEASLVKQIELVNIIVWLLIVVVVLLTIGVGSKIAKSFSEPILALIQTMKKAENGDLTVQASAKKNNEIKLLCESFNHMIGNMNRLLGETRGVVHETLQSSEVLVQSTRDTVRGFTQLTTSVAEIAAGANSQAMDTQDGVRAMADLGTSIEEVSETTQSIYTSTQGVRTLLEEASGAMHDLNTTTAAASQISGEVDESVKELNTLNKDIEKMMSILNNISEETNLLAFNASIEAARAGEVGRGFAVVASEVRKLSEESRVSTSSISGILKKIEQKTFTTAELMEKANHIFDEQSQAVSHTSAIFEGIISTLHKVDTEVDQIRIRVEGMNTLRVATTDKIENIAAVIEESTAATEEVSMFSEEQRVVIGQFTDLCHNLVEEMQKLENSIQQFQV